MSKSARSVDGVQDAIRVHKPTNAERNEKMGKFERTTHRDEIVETHQQAVCSLNNYVIT